MKIRILITSFLGIIICLYPVNAQKKKDPVKESEKKESGISSSIFSGLGFRSIGPARASGRFQTLHPDLLFAGSEFGFYFSLDGGNEWIEFKSGSFSNQHPKV